MAFKVLLMYNLPRTSGASPGGTEPHYYLGAAPNTKDPALVAAAINLMNARTQLMGNNVTAIGFRISVPGTRNRSYRVLVGPGPGASLNPAPVVNQGTADIPNSAVQLTIYSDILQRRNMYLMGMPDAFVTTAGAGNPDFAAAGLSGFEVKWNAWTAVMLNGSWGFRALADPPPGQPVEITSWANQPDSPFELILGVPIASGVWGVNDVVHVRGTLMTQDQFDRPVGRWKIRSVSVVGAEKLYVLRNSAAFDSGQIEIPGTVESVAFEYKAYADLQIAAQTSRKRGVGPVRRRGRSRARRRRVVS